MLKFRGRSGAKVCKACRSRQELPHEHFLATFGFYTAENEPLKFGVDSIHLASLASAAPSRLPHQTRSQFFGIDIANERKYYQFARVTDFQFTGRACVWYSAERSTSELILESRSHSGEATSDRKGGKRGRRVRIPPRPIEAGLQLFDEPSRLM